MNIDPYLKLMADKNASDLFFVTGAPISIKVEGGLVPVSKSPLRAGLAGQIAYALMTDEQQAEFEIQREMNIGLTLHGVGRFRVNIYVQRGEISLVIRYIKAKIPSLKELNLPTVLQDVIMHKTGMILMVGATGSGKSTSMAAMINHRNIEEGGHILTVEDPVEFVFQHKKSIVSQREVGLDTLNYQNALREAMREAPDLIMIGEIRDQATMEAAVNFADTGHLVISTLHAVNANQALDRIINLFPPDSKKQILMDLSLNLKAIVAQRLVTGLDGRRVAAVEVLINTPYISELIRKGSMADIKETMEKGKSSGMQTFDQALYDLYKHNHIALQTALTNADSRSDLEWRINFGGGMESLDKKSDTLHFASDEAVNEALSVIDEDEINEMDGLLPLDQTKL